MPARPLARTAAAVAVLVLAAAARGQAPTLTTFVNNGPSSNRVDMVFVGDGYTAGESAAYQAHVGRMMSHMFNDGMANTLRDPFPRYNRYFNAHRVNVVSAQSGADDPSIGHFVNTALDASYRWDGQTQRLLYLSNAKADAAVNTAINGAFAVDMRLATVNATQYGGGGGRYAVYAGGNAAAPEVALHELGHSFSNLADEYGGFAGPYTGAEPSEVNVTTNASGAKWAHWHGYNQPGVGVIGAYEGGRYYDRGIYRPSDNSKMRSLDRPFDAVSREKMILDIYRIVRPLDAHRPNSATLTDPGVLWVTPIDANTIDHQWYINGQLVPGATGETFVLVDYAPGPGTYEVTARSYDPTDWVRVNLELLRQDVTWTVVLTAVPEPGFVLAVAAVGVAVRRRRRPAARVSS